MYVCIMIIGSKKIHLSEVNSTNEYLYALYENGEVEEGTVVYAGFQTNGKGMGENTWFSDRDTNLLFSIIIYPTFIEPSNVFVISKIVSLGICDFLQTIIGNEISIKWPNDILVSDCKIAGILIKNDFEVLKMKASIIGVGLNINQQSFPEKIHKPVSLYQLTGNQYDTNSCLDELLLRIVDRYKQLIEGTDAIITDNYADRLYLAGVDHEYTLPNGNKFNGMIIGVDEDGRLLIQKQDSEILTFNFKEVIY